MILRREQGLRTAIWFLSFASPSRSSSHRRITWQPPATVRSCALTLDTCHLRVYNAVIEAELFTGDDVSARVDRSAWHNGSSAYWHEHAIRCATVIDEPRDVAALRGIDVRAEKSVLRRTPLAQHEQVIDTRSVVVGESKLCLMRANQFTRVLDDKCSGPD
jgi:hypothetical protein